MSLESMSAYSKEKIGGKNEFFVLL